MANFAAVVENTFAPTAGGEVAVDLPLASAPQTGAPAAAGGNTG